MRAHGAWMSLDGISGRSPRGVLWHVPKHPLGRVEEQIPGLDGALALAGDGGISWAFRPGKEIQESLQLVLGRN